MEKAIKFINEQMNKEILVKPIRVYGWQKEYDYTLVSGVGKYLFEDFEVIDNIAPITNERAVQIVDKQVLDLDTELASARKSEDRAVST